MPTTVLIVTDFAGEEMRRADEAMDVLERTLAAWVAPASHNAMHVALTAVRAVLLQQGERIAQLEQPSTSFAALVLRQRAAYSASVKAQRAEVRALVAERVADEMRAFRCAVNTSTAPATSVPPPSSILIDLLQSNRSADASDARTDARFAAFEREHVRRSDVEAMLLASSRQHGERMADVLRSGIDALALEMRRALEASRSELRALESKVARAMKEKVNAREHATKVDALKDELLHVSRRGLGRSEIEDGALGRLRNETTRLARELRGVESAVAQRAVASDVERALHTKASSSALEETTAALRAECVQLRRALERQRASAAAKIEEHAGALDSSARATAAAAAAAAAAEERLSALSARLVPLEREVVCARWLWRGGHAASKSAAAWCVEQTNTHPDLFRFDGPGSSVVLVRGAGLYKLSVGCFAESAAPFDVIVNDEIVLRQRLGGVGGGAASGYERERVRGHRAGTLTGSTLSEFVVLPAMASVQVSFGAEGPGVQGFMGLEKL